MKDYYTELTVDNFYYRIGSANKNSWYYDSSGTYNLYWTSASFTAPSISYNKNTGVLSASHGNLAASINISTGSKSTSANASTTKYCIYLE